MGTQSTQRLQQPEPPPPFPFNLLESISGESGSLLPAVMITILVIAVLAGIARAFM